MHMLPATPLLQPLLPFCLGSVTAACLNTASKPAASTDPLLPSIFSHLHHDPASFTLSADSFFQPPSHTNGIGWWNGCTGEMRAPSNREDIFFKKKQEVGHQLCKGWWQLGGDSRRRKELHLVLLAPWLGCQPLLCCASECHCGHPGHQK